MTALVLLHAFPLDAGMYAGVAEEFRRAAFHAERAGVRGHSRP